MRKRLLLGAMVAILVISGLAAAQHDKEAEPTSVVYFEVLKDDNGKPVRNASIILHEVDTKGRQERGDLELKTDPDGKTNFDGVPYGMLRVQVIAHGFQTFGEDYDIEKSKTDILIKLKRPQGQYSVYDDHAANPTPKPDTPPQDQNKKPN